MKMADCPTDEQAQELFNAVRQEIHYKQSDGTDIVVGYEPVSPGDFLRAGIQQFAKPPCWLPDKKLIELMHDFVLGGESADDFGFDYLGYAKAVMISCGIQQPEQEDQP
jgi:hypothetical protein